MGLFASKEEKMKPVIIIAISVLIIGVSVTSISAQSQSDIPTWVKGVADFWVKGEISDSEFGESISFLIEQNIIQVEIPKVDDTETVNKIMGLEIDNRNLENENKELKNTINSLEKDIDVKQQALYNFMAETERLNNIIFENESKTFDTDTSQLTLDELKKQSVEWNYKDILRNEEKYIGKIIFVEGKIWYIDERKDVDGKVLLSVLTREGKYGVNTDLMYIWYGNPSRLLDDDMIEAYIVIDEIYIRESQFDTSEYFPVGSALHTTCTNC